MKRGLLLRTCVYIVFFAIIIMLQGENLIAQNKSRGETKSKITEKEFPALFKLEVKEDGTYRVYDMNGKLLDNSDRIYNMTDFDKSLNSSENEVKSTPIEIDLDKKAQDRINDFKNFDDFNQFIDESGNSTELKNIPADKDQLQINTDVDKKHDPAPTEITSEYIIDVKNKNEVIKILGQTNTEYRIENEEIFVKANALKILKEMGIEYSVKAQNIKVQNLNFNQLKELDLSGSSSSLLDSYIYGYRTVDVNIPDYSGTTPGFAYSELLSVGLLPVRPLAK